MFNRKIASEVAIGIIAVIAIILGYYFWKSNNIVVAPIMVKNSGTTTTTTLPEKQVYRNEKYGFELTFPETWKGYSATSRTLNWGSDGTSDSIDFALPDQKDGLFNISFHTKKQYDSIENSGVPFGMFLNKNNDYVFVWNQAQYAANPQMEERMKEVQSIIKTFKFINSNNATSDWQTYRNDKYGFEFKYPKDWTVKFSNESRQPGGNFVNINIINNTLSSAIYNININIFNNNADLSSRDWFEKANAGFDYKITDVVFNGVPAVKESTETSSSYSIYINHDKNIFMFDTTKNWNELSENLRQSMSYDKESENIRQQILSTFKFTK
jgi:hypothetical protein